MPEAVELLYIRNGLNYVIEQFSIYVFKCCTRATTPKLLENRKNYIRLKTKKKDLVSLPSRRERIRKP